MPRPLTFSPNDGLKQYSGNAQGAADGGLPTARNNYFDGLARIGGQLQELSEGITRQEDQAEGLRVSEAADAYSLNLATRISELDPGSDTYTMDVQRAVQETTQGTLESNKFKFGHRQAQLQEQLSGISTRSLINSVQARQGALEDRAVTKFTEGANAAANLMISNPGNWDQIKTDFLERITPALDAVPIGDRQKLVTGFLNDAVLATAMGRADAKDFKGAMTFLEANAGSIDPDKLTNTRYRIENLEQRDINEKRAAEAAARAAAKDAAEKAEKAAEIADILDGSADITSLPSGYYTDNPAELANLRTIAAVQHGFTMQKMRQHAEAVDRFAAGQPLSPTDSDIVFNALFKQTVGTLRANGVSDEEVATQAYSTITQRMVQQTQQVPPSVKARIGSLSQSSEPAAVAQASYFDGVIRNTAPWTAQLDTGLTDRAKLIRDLTQARVGGEASLEQYQATAAEFANVTAADIDKRQNAANGLPGGTLKDFTEATGKTDPSAYADWVSTRRAYHVQSGDPEMATKLATERVKGSYATTRVGGVEREVRGIAPESLYPKDLRQGLGDENVAKLIDADVTESLGNASIPLPEVKEGARFTLVSDEQTKRDTREGRAPSFPVMVPVPGTPGAFQPLLVEQDGRTTAVRWSGPASSEEAWKNPQVQMMLETRRREVEEGIQDQGRITGHDAAGNPIIEYDPEVAVRAAQRRRGEATERATKFLQDEKLAGTNPDAAAAEVAAGQDGQAKKIADPTQDPLKASFYGP